jgi:hypothetical protein
MKTNYRLKGNEKIYNIGLSDLHVGSEQFNEDFFWYAIDTIDNIKQQKRIYLLGDLAEAAGKNIGNASFKTTMTLDDQIDFIIDAFKPLSDDIVNTVPGNHCARLNKDYDINVMNIIGKALDVPVAPFHIDEYKINKIPYTVYTAHGKGSSMYAHTAQGKFIRETEQFSADLKMQGHNHRMDFFSRPVLTSNGLKREYYAFTGSFLDYKGYAKDMLLPVLPPAFQLITVNKDLITRSIPYYVDQVRPDLLEV